ncbi:MAG: CBS domain-containing protein [Myxococcota bacterium]|jgi:CBS domain-containing protein|nr:CBS domain-containing protein [Myxococcota bacterium]
MKDRVPIPQARELMTSRVVSVEPNADIVDAVHLLLKHGHSGAPVVDDGKRLLGVLSEHDCVRVLAEVVGTGWPQGNVSDHMSKDIETVEAREDALALAARFSQGTHRRVFVVEDGKLAGVVTRSDLLRGLAKLEEEMGRGKKVSTWSIIEGRRRDLG